MGLNHRLPTELTFILPDVKLNEPVMLVDCKLAILLLYQILFIINMETLNRI